MKSVVTYIRHLLGWSDDVQENRLSFKRDRANEGFSSDDETPTLKRPKQFRSVFSTENMNSNTDTNGWGKQETERSVQYVPIQIESNHPTTSTPIEAPSRLGARVRTVPVQFVVKNNESSTPVRKPRNGTPVLHAVLDDDNDYDDDQEVRLVEAKPATKNKIFINLDDYEEDPSESDEVIFVKKVTNPPPVKHYKCFFSSDGQDVTDSEEPTYLRLTRKLNGKSLMSPKSYSKFVAPPGITKTYKRAPTPVAKCLLRPSSMNLSKNRFLGHNSTTRTTLAEVFNLDEKKNYRELIKKVAESMKPASFGKPMETINLTESSFKKTLKCQKKSLYETNLIQKDLFADKENDSAREYDPITVASINSSDSEVEVVPSETSTSSMRIDPINTLKDSYRDSAVTSIDWLSKIDDKYKKKKQDTQKKLNDARQLSDIIYKVNSEQKIAHLEQKLKHELCLPESLFVEPQPIVELPTLTPDQEKVVSKALGTGPPGQLLVEKFGLRIHRRDLQTLSGLNWLNDEVINFYMNLLMQRSEQRSDLPKVYAVNTFFYPKLMQGGQSGLRRWTRKVDVFAHDLLIVPVHMGVHWCLCIVDFRARSVSYFDSMGGRNGACLAALQRYLKDEHQDKKGQPFDDAGWTAECLKDIPQQMNGSDCGMFACTFAEFAARGAPYTFDQAHMPLLRRKAALEILTGQLLL